MSTPDITFDELYLREAALLPIRRQLYHSSGEGYFVFKGFLDVTQTEHMRRFWSSLEPQDWHKPYVNAERMYRGCPNYVEEAKGQVSYLNFLWNEPPDELTHAVAFAIQMLRNRIEARNLYREIFPLAGRSASYRIVLSRNIDEIVVPHRDWVGEAFDPRRLQVTLFLAEKGKDYEGIGFGIETNYGKSKVFGEDVEVHPGDLVLWRYNNLHFAREVSSDGTIGFMRMLMPPEEIVDQSTALRLRTIEDRLRRGLKRIPLVERHFLPTYRKLRRILHG